MTEIEKELGDALFKLRKVFAKHGIPCPDIIAYSDTQSAYEAIPHLRLALGPTTWAMTSGGKPMGEACLAGFSLMFETRYIERPGTGLELDDGIAGRIFLDRMDGK